MCFQIGIRASGKPKEHWESTFGLKQFWSQYVKEVGPALVAEQIIAKLKDQKIDEIYVSFDIDALDAEYASSTGTPESGGLSPHECTTIIDMLRKELPITGADMMEIAPFIGEGRDVTLMSAGSISTSLINSLGE
jgi:agmatinase